MSKIAALPQRLAAIFICYTSEGFAPPFRCDALEIERRSKHKIRKTYGTALLDANVEDSLVMSQMGHSDITTTRKYYYYSRRNAEHKREQIMNAIPF